MQIDQVDLWTVQGLHDWLLEDLQGSLNVLEQ
jgi:hypothetical protein